jgi:hypothetical protein
VIAVISILLDCNELTTEFDCPLRECSRQLDQLFRYLRVAALF